MKALDHNLKYFQVSFRLSILFNKPQKVPVGIKHLEYCRHALTCGMCIFKNQQYSKSLGVIFEFLAG